MKKDIIVGAIPSGIFSFIASAIVSVYIVPFPKDQLSNAINNGFSGLASASVTAIITTVILFKKYHK